MKECWITITIQEKQYYTLKEVCKELGFKTQKAFIEQYQELVCVFKGLIAGKFIAINDFNFHFSKREEVVDSNEDFIEENEIPMEVKKKFAKLLVAKYHPDNGGDTNMFLWANKLKKTWEKSEYITLLTRIATMSNEDFLSFMETYGGEDKHELMQSRGYTIEGSFVF